jgi:hypothetical protein
MRFMFNILFNTLFLLVNARQNQIEHPRSFNSALQALTADRLEEATPEEFVPMRNMSDQEIVSFYLLSGVCVGLC